MEDIVMAMWFIKQNQSFYPSPYASVSESGFEGFTLDKTPNLFLHLELWDQGDRPL